MKIINFLKEQFHKMKFKCERHRKPWLLATAIGSIPVLIGLILLDYFFLLSGTFALGLWIILSILFIFKI